jgi:hypothetical protein
MGLYTEIKEDLKSELKLDDDKQFNLAYSQCYKKAVSETTHNGHDAKEVLKPIIKELINKFYSNRVPKTKVGKILKSIWNFIK